ncbi:MAG: YqeG family HAD IIIA-type phosphatase [Planctomycetia bacterium]|nr:YqeG family HAD IIIA-type phosphatase [Planctomycetia bacterium]
MKIRYSALTKLLLRPFLPDLRVNVVSELTPGMLKEAGITSVLLDVDCTLKRYDTDILEGEVQIWLETLKNTGIRVCLLSNGKGPRIGRFAARYGLPFVAMALKPMPFGCWRAVREQGWDGAKTAMVGDQIFADVMAGNLAGLTTILVTPIHPEMEPLFTRVKRPFEKIILRAIPIQNAAESPSHSRDGQAPPPKSPASP